MFHVSFSLHQLLDESCVQLAASLLDNTDKPTKVASEIFMSCLKLCQCRTTTNFYVVKNVKVYKINQPRLNNLHSSFHIGEFC